MRSLHRVGMGITAAVVTLTTVSALGCKFAGPTAHAIDSAEVGVDITAPTSPSVNVVSVRRGDNGSSCDGIGRVTVSLASTDDRTPPGALGFRLRANDDTLSLPQDPVVTDNDGTLGISFDDERALDAQLTVTAVDLAGNESAPTTVRVEHTPFPGCHVAPTTALPLGGVFVVGLLLRRRRRS